MKFWRLRRSLRDDNEWMGNCLIERWWANLMPPHRAYRHERLASELPFWGRVIDCVIALLAVFN